VTTALAFGIWAILQAGISQVCISQAGISGEHLPQAGISQACISNRHASLTGMHLVRVHLADVHLVGEVCDFDFQKILICP
jgi:hypothetical protein